MDFEPSIYNPFLNNATSEPEPPSILESIASTVVGADILTFGSVIEF